MLRSVGVDEMCVTDFLKFVEGMCPSGMYPSAVKIIIWATRSVSAANEGCVLSRKLAVVSMIEKILLSWMSVTGMRKGMRRSSMTKAVYFFSLLHIPLNVSVTVMSFNMFLLPCITESMTRL